MSALLLVAPAAPPSAAISDNSTERSAVGAAVPYPSDYIYGAEPLSYDALPGRNVSTPVVGSTASVDIRSQALGSQDDRGSARYDSLLLLRVSHTLLATNTPKPGVGAPKPVVKASGAADRSSAVYVDVEMPDGSIRTVGSQPGGIHAEDAAQALSPGGRMSQPYGWRMGPDGKVTWQPVGVCTSCQAKYPPSMFPAGTTSAPGGAWTSK